MKLEKCPRFLAFKVLENGYILTISNLVVDPILISTLAFCDFRTYIKTTTYFWLFVNLFFFNEKDMMYS